MSVALTVPALVAGALLVVAGAAKLVDPANTAGALAALGLPSSPWLVRAGAAVEAAIGAAAVVVGGGLWWSLVAASYVAFTAFVVGALRARTMVGTCGCFGHEDTPPHPAHVVLNALFAGVALAAAVDGLVPATVLADDVGRGIVLAGLGTLALYVVYAAYIDLPRAAARRHADARRAADS